MERLGETGQTGGAVRGDRSNRRSRCRRHGVWSQTAKQVKCVRRRSNGWSGEAEQGGETGQTDGARRGDRSNRWSGEGRLIKQTEQLQTTRRLEPDGETGQICAAEVKRMERDGETGQTGGARRRNRQLCGADVKRMKWEGDR